MNHNLLIAATLAALLTAPDPGGKALHVEVFGSAPDVVLITGLLGVAEGFHEVAVELEARGHRSLIVEPLGVGTSLRPKAADYSLTAQAQRVAGVLDSFGVRKALVVGQGVSAAIAYRLAAARPDLVRNVVALEGGAPATAGTPSLARALRYAPLLRLFGGRKRVRHIFERQLKEASFDSSWVTPGVVDAYARGPLRDLGATIAAYRAMNRAREPVPLPEVLDRIACPVLVLRGEKGRVPQSEVELVRRHVAMVVVQEIPNAGVFLHEERPAAVAAALTAFDSPGAIVLSGVEQRR
ncbi:MAG: alpha/beta hydrolase [Gemmatimonadota bacterium]|jgi:pimeloyl-ACP methyl ester carboxylesterase